ncbi:MAG: DUF2807 domain-containing protein [Pseudomonadota bacterium]
MYRFLLAFVLIAVAGPAWAAERSFTVSNFDRVRVDGPFEVRVIVGGGTSSSGKASGDARVLADLDLGVQNNTLVVRRGNGGWGERGKVTGPAPVVTIMLPALRGATVIGGGKLAISGKINSPRIDFQITGTGSIDAQGIAAEDVMVTLIGFGHITLAGRSGRARLVTNGSGTIAATGLDVGDLLVRLDGPGETQASARFTADVTSTGLGRVVVAGNPKCTVRALAGGPVSCGAP